MKQGSQFNSAVPASTSPTTTSRGATTRTTVENVARTVKVTAARKVWPILEDLIRVADAANIPVCGGAFGVLTYLIDAFNEVEDNKDAYAQLEVILESYTKTLNDFVSVLPTSYLSSSTKRDAVIARHAIKAFDGDLQRVLALAKQQEIHNKRSHLLRCAYRKRIRDDIEECMRQLEQSHRSFHDAASNVLLAKVSYISSRTDHCDEWGITGTKSLPPHAIGRMKPYHGIRAWCGRGEFVEADVDGTDRVVKLFRGEKGERAFLNALAFLQKNSGPYLQIYGYSAGASIPFIVFHSGALVSFRDFIWHSMGDSRTPDEHIMRVWKCAVEMKEAVEFIATSTKDDTRNLPPGGAMVDASGSMIMDVSATHTIQCYATRCAGAIPIFSLKQALLLYFGASLAFIPTCQRLTQALETEGERTITRKTFEDPQFDPHQMVRSIPPGFCMMGRDNRVTHLDMAHLGDIYLFDRKRAAVTRQVKFSKIGVVDKVKVGWTVHPYPPQMWEASQVSDGIYRTGGNTRLFAKKAKKLADELGALIEDIYYPIEIAGSVSFNEPLSSLTSQSSRPISLFLHLDEHPIRSYWSFSNLPLTSEEMMAEKHSVDAVGVPRLHIGGIRTEYIPLNKQDFQEWMGEEGDDETVSEDVIVPGGWDSTW
ncbi:hypothetical protein FRB99_001946 [Tulasnella sp. 403]|nr:hypothetical protein FRB99_001946 [Tulasnella sp. 403]